MFGYDELRSRDERLASSLAEKYAEIVRSCAAMSSGIVSGGRDEGQSSSLREWLAGPSARKSQSGLRESEFIVVFKDSASALRCAVEIHRAVKEYNDEVPKQREFTVRVGVHTGLVLGQSDGIPKGEAVKVASSLLGAAKPGSICVSERVFHELRHESGYRFERLEAASADTGDAQGVYSVSSSTSKSENQELDRRRLAVLPLVSLSPDPNDEYFADGLTEELITTLSRIRELKVIARTSAMRYKGEKKSVEQIGRELKVGSVIEGSVRKAEGRVRISVQLINCATEEHLWAERYDRELKDIFAVQTDIADKVASALEVKLVRGGRELMTSRTEDTGAYTLYLKGRYHWNTRSEAGLARATKFFEESVSRDPGYALAYVGLADCYSIMGLYGFRRPSVVYPQARELALKALELNPELAEAHASMGEILMHYYFDWKQAGYELDRALHLSPNYATAHLWKGTYLAALGRLEDSVSTTKKAEELDPLSMICVTEVGKILYLSRRYEEAEEQYMRSLTVDPKFAIAHKGLAMVYAQKSMFDLGIVEIQKAVELSERSAFTLADAGYIYAVAGMKEEAEKILKELRHLSEEQYVPAYGIAEIYAGLGDIDTSLTWLERAYADRGSLTWILTDPCLDSLRGEERFKIILSKMGLPVG
jgi:adenylate cyclase